MYCSRNGGLQCGKGWSKSFFLENKVVINFNFRHGAKKSGPSGHPFRSYGFFQWKSKMKEFTNVTGPVTSFAGRVNLLLPSWISWPWAWFEAFSQIFSNHFHPEKWFLSKKGPKEGERVARGHFHERVGESPVHWLPPGVGFTQKAFSVSENGPFENFLRSNSIFI